VLRPSSRNYWRYNHLPTTSVIFDFKRATAFCLAQRLSKHKTTRYARSLGCMRTLWLSLATPMSGSIVSTKSVWCHAWFSKLSTQWL